MAIDTLERFRGCLLGGAVGDALGAPLEFLGLADVRRTNGARVDLADFARAAFTDDTQMTLFTAEGLIRAGVRLGEVGTASITESVYRAYLRWLHTQGAAWPDTAEHLPDAGAEPDGWLVTNPVLHRRAAPGNTCLSALRSRRRGSRTEPINGSKGCGGVMRAAPVGLFLPEASEAFEVGCDIAALTHGHPSGYLPAGALAAMVARLVAGDVPDAAVAVARRLVEAAPDSDETAAALAAAVALAARGVPTPEDLEELGGGWVGEEALAIAVACALTADDLPSALSVAVVHSGDSDSTGAICGNLLGAHHGAAAIPAAWLERLEGTAVVDTVARDLHRLAAAASGTHADTTAEWAARYPGS